MKNLIPAFLIWAGLFCLSSDLTKSFDKIEKVLTRIAIALEAKK